MKKTKMPKLVKTIEEAMAEIEEQNSTDFYFATYSQEKRGRIWRLKSDETPEFIANRRLAPNTICSHNGILYDAGEYKSVHSTLEDSEGNNAITSRRRSIRSLCSHNGTLYDAGHYAGTFDTLNGSDKPVSKTDWIISLCSYKGKLYGSGINNKIHDVLNDPKAKHLITENQYPINAFCVHNDELYFIKYMKGIGEQIQTVEKKTDRIWTRKRHINALCSHVGKLMDAGDSCKIRHTTSGKIVFESNEIITAMCSHRRSK